ncbi:MAG: hypothetical protein ACTSP0_10505 [Alphaproteobacteria bacterium]
MLSKFPLKTLFIGLFAALMLAGASFAAINFGNKEKLLPAESAEAVVEKFYEYVSTAKIRGGSLLINEAYKLTSGGQTRTDRALFLGIVNRYPPGFKVETLESRIAERHAVVTIEYQLPSSFGSAYAMRTDIHLNVDEETNSWKLDFRGDTDDQDRETIVKAMKSKPWDAASGKNKGKSR